MGWRQKTIETRGAIRNCSGVVRSRRPESSRSTVAYLVLSVLGGRAALPASV
jgi:hypothetical protein